jgi:Type II transport protein GspH
MAGRGRQKHGESGVTIVQVVITLTIISIVSTFTVLGIRTARANIRLTNSSRRFAGHLEKARADAVRRHGDSSVTPLSLTSYSVTMDFDLNGSVETRTFNLEDGVTFTEPPPPGITFDWRGRINRDPVSFTMENTIEVQASVDVSGAGDITFASDIYEDYVPAINVNPGGSAGVDMGSVINGNTAPPPNPTPYPSATPPSGDTQPTPTPTSTPYPTPTPTATPTPPPNSTPTPTPTSTPTPQPTPTPTPTATPTPTPSPTPQCVLNASPASISIRKNGGFANVSLSTSTGNGSISVGSKPANLNVTLLSGGNGTASFKIMSNNTSRGTFTVTFTSPCGTKNVSVTVTN